MRVLTGSAALLVGFAVLAVLYVIAVRAQERAARTPEETALRRAREVWIGYDAAIDSIDKLLAQDAMRLFLTEDEQIGGHVGLRPVRGRLQPDRCRRGGDR